MTERSDLFGQARDARVHSREAARSMFGLARSFVLAGIGAMALAKDETEYVANRLVERGLEARRRMGRGAEGMADRMHDRGALAQSRMQGRMDEMLQRMNIPTRSDIASLNAKIAVLSAKIDAMNAQAGGESTTSIDPASQI